MNEVINIITSSSNGNCYIYNKDLMIDIGVSLKKIKNEYKNIKLLLLTHQHFDHFNKATIKKIAYERATLRFVCCKWLVTPLIECGVQKKNIIVLEPDKQYDFGKYLITPFKAEHDVPNCGYKIEIKKTGYKIFHATDINTLQGIEAKNYNLYCLEANYQEEELKTRLKEKEERGEFAYERRVLSTHLSKEEADLFLLSQMGDNSECIYCHQHITKEKNDGDNSD